MPRRKRAQEFRRRLREAVEQTEAEIEREERQQALLTLADDADPLDDIFWDEHENPEKYLCSCYSDRTRAAILADAREEIDAHLKQEDA